MDTRLSSYPGFLRKLSDSDQRDRPGCQAHAIAERAAYEAFRRMLDERHAAIRERHESFTRAGDEAAARGQAQTDAPDAPRGSR